MANEERLRAWFESVDVQGTGQINAFDLKKALAAGNLHFSDSIAQQMIRMHDADRNGIMSFAEFVALNKFLSNVQNAYIVMERGRGFLILNDVYEALTMAGYALDQPAFYTLCESFDETKKGRFRLDDFISLCIFAAIGIACLMDCLYMFKNKVFFEKRPDYKVLLAILLEIACIVAGSVVARLMGIKVFGKWVYSALQVLVWVKWAIGGDILEKYSQASSGYKHDEWKVLVFSTAFLLNAALAGARSKWAPSWPW